MLNHNNVPGAGSITETMEFMRKMWEGMGAPAMGIPSLSVEEINKKIADLKTVASWLELNMNMLRATIQTLEVQSATLSTLQAMGAILTPHDAGQAAAKEDVAAAAPFGFPGWPSQAVPPQAPGESVAASDPSGSGEQSKQSEEDSAGTENPAEDASPAAAKADSSPFTFPQADFQAPLSNPNAWWNLLQNQFQQAVGNVLAEQEPEKKKAPVRQKKATKAVVKAKPRTRAKSTVVQSRQSKPASRKPKSP